MVECEKIRIGREFLDKYAWPNAFRNPKHDRCYCDRCYPSTYPDTNITAGLKYVIPRGWTRFGIFTDERFAKHHDVWNKWANCYHGTSFENAKSIVEHRQLLLPRDHTMEGVKIQIRKGHIPGEEYLFTTPTIKYAEHQAYAHTYAFRSRQTNEIYKITVALQCKQKLGSFIVQPETVGARELQYRICPHIPNEEIEWKTKNRSATMIYGILLKVKSEDDKNDYHVSKTPVVIIKKKKPISKVSPRISTPTSESRTEGIPENRRKEPVHDIENQSHQTKKLVKTILISGFFLIIISLPIAALTMGTIYKNDCPIQPWISRWMFIFGTVCIACFSLIFIIILITFTQCSSDTTCGYLIGGCFGFLLLLFLFAWLIAGSVWTFRVKPKVQFNQTNLENYCEKKLYNFTFGFLIAQYGLIGLLMCLVCTGRLYALLCD